MPINGWNEMDKGVNAIVILKSGCMEGLWDFEQRLSITTERRAKKDFHQWVQTFV